jgi:hypothetical protein
MTSPERTPDELRVLRDDVSDTVQELSRRADVPARARAQKDETVQRLQQQVGKARASAAEKASDVRTWLPENPVLVAATGLAAALIVFRVLRSRAHA